MASLAKRFGITLPSCNILLPPTDTPSPGLSSGAKVGIGVGVALGVLAVIIAFILLCLEKRRKSQTGAPQQIPEMEDQDQELAEEKRWAVGKWRSEVDAQVEPQELEDKTVHVVPGASGEA